MENQPTILDKAVKLSIVVGVLIVAFSISYYFIKVPTNKTSIVGGTKDNQASQSERVVEKEIRIGDEFLLKNGRVLTVTEVTVGNYYSGSPINPDMKRAQVAIRIHSDGGPLEEEEYKKMYILKNNQLIKLSNTGGAPWGQYWFEMPQTNDFDGMKLYFGSEAVIILAPYIRNNNL